MRIKREGGLSSPFAAPRAPKPPLAWKEKRNMDEKNRSKNRIVNLFALRLAVSAYLAYLGFDLLRAYLVGASTLSPAAAWGCGVGFMAAGLGFGVYSFLHYRRETAAERRKTEETDKSPDEE